MLVTVGSPCPPPGLNPAADSYADAPAERLPGGPQPGAQKCAALRDVLHRQRRAGPDNLATGSSAIWLPETLDLRHPQLPPGSLAFPGEEKEKKKRERKGRTEEA